MSVVLRFPSVTIYGIEIIVVVTHGKFNLKKMALLLVVSLRERHPNS